MIELTKIPENPGVYFMKSDKKIIYVGKAKNLKKRVSSYFTGKYNDKKTEELVKNIKEIDYIITKSELDALVLENNMIKKHKPKYNIALKDQKTYPYIYISNGKFPKIEILRYTGRLSKINGDIFGPYPSGALFLIKILKKVFKIRDCKRDMSKKYDRPCLKYYMDLCMGPCTYKEIDQEYNTNVKELKQFLSGKEKDIIKNLAEKMQKASENMEFEKAIIYRERINALKKVLESQISEYGKELDEDVFVYKLYGENIFLCVLNIRNGKIIGKNFMKVSLKSDLTENIFENIFLQYYQIYPTTKNIILDPEYKSKTLLIDQWLNRNKGRKVNLHFPMIKSRRKEILEMAYLNLDNEINNHYYIKKNLEKGLQNLKEKLDLKKIPYKIECFDISNIQGKDAVAAMSVAIGGKLEKKSYRKFKIRSKDTPDDFAMMKEVLTRRYSKIDKESLPDLILLDGGKGQLGIGEEVLTRLNKAKYVDLISIAKREEEVFKSGEIKPYILSKTSEALKILQRLRDEAHRFGVKYHRTLRKKRIINSELDEIEGIGKIRKEKLLNKFKSVKRIFDASVEELEEVVSKEIALKLKERGKNSEENISD